MRKNSIIAIIAALTLGVGLTACGQNNGSGTDGQTLGEQTESAMDQAGESVGNAIDTATDVVSDSAITAAVNSKLLANSSTAGMDINVETNDGVVTLTGTVTSEAEKELAGRIAANTNGVSDVINNLQVRGG